MLARYFCFVAILVGFSHFCWAQAPKGFEPASVKNVLQELGLTEDDSNSPKIYTQCKRQFKGNDWELALLVGGLKDRQKNILNNIGQIENGLGWIHELYRYEFTKDNSAEAKLLSKLSRKNMEKKIHLRLMKLKKMGVYQNGDVALQGGFQEVKKIKQLLTPLVRCLEEVESQVDPDEEFQQLLVKG